MLSSEELNQSGRVRMHGNLQEELEKKNEHNQRNEFLYSKQMSDWPTTAM